MLCGLTNPTSPSLVLEEALRGIQTPSPEDSFNYINHTGDTQIFGKKVTSDNIRRL